jgi:hypothetical protein
MHIRQARWQNPERFFGLFIEAEGDKGAGGAGAGDKQPETVSKAELDKALGELKKLQDADAGRVAAAKKKADEEAAASGKGAELAKQKEAELELERKKTATYEAREKARADKTLAALPKERQEALGKLREKMILEAFVELLEVEPVPRGEADGEDRSTPPFAGGSRDTGGRDKSKYKPHPRTVELMEDRLMRDASIFDRLSTRVEKDEETGQRVTMFTMPIRKQFAEMRRGEATKLTIENAEARRQATGKR